MTNRLQSLLAGSLAACMITVAAGTAALWASETSEQSELATGAWQITHQIETLEVPGLPAAMVERMAQDSKYAAPREACQTGTSEARPDPAMFHALGGTCQWKDWQAAGGDADSGARLFAPSGASGSASVSLSGTYTADTFTLRSETIGRNDAGELELRLVSQLAGRLSGACAS